MGDGANAAADSTGGRGVLRKAQAALAAIPSLRTGGSGSGSGSTAAAAMPAYLLKTAEEYARDTRSPVVHSKRYFKHKRLPVRSWVEDVGCAV